MSGDRYENSRYVTGVVASMNADGEGRVCGGVGARFRIMNGMNLCVCVCVFNEMFCNVM